MLAVSTLYIIPRKGKVVKFPWYLWLPWFVWVGYKSDFSNMAAIQRLAILLTPIFVASVCSSFQKVNLKMIKKSYDVLWVGSLCIYGCAVLQSGSLLADADFYTVEGIAMTFTLIAVAAIAGINKTAKQGYITFVLCLLILIFTRSRMPVLVLPAILIFGFHNISMRNRIILCIFLVCGATILFMSAPAQENIFLSGYGSLSDIISLDPTLVKASGRLTAWPLYIKGIENIWFGDGSTESVVFGNATFGAGKWSHPHNEYIRVLFDYGIIGIVLLSVPVVWLLALLYKKGRSNNANDMRWLCFVGFNGVFATLLLGISGNVLMYVAYIGNVLFATIGYTFAFEDKTINARNTSYENLFGSQQTWQTQWRRGNGLSYQ